jgi:hypothetical protein
MAQPEVLAILLGGGVPGCSRSPSTDRNGRFRLAYRPIIPISAAFKPTLVGFRPHSRLGLADRHLATVDGPSQLVCRDFAAEQTF